MPSVNNLTQVCHKWMDGRLACDLGGWGNVG